ncbi:hypothetical protein Rt10032_c05g2504 [Rhodotorula toruloides]|uniref:Uncharacterized protein n=1 Tax=Rhodotorula toruloides TaxID=5286 RepID=A0A511KDM5_RHOTO|nr:hypothetical protein Rt10032_c05g2504 [Rhodotorula toruloides]
MATLRIRPPTERHWAPLISPVSPSTASSSPHDSSSLSARCRLLASRFGENAVHEDDHFEHPEPQPQQQPQTSPLLQGRASPKTPSPSRAAPFPLSPISPRTVLHSQLHPPPTPEGTHILNEILEEEAETPRTEKDVTSEWAPPRLDVPTTTATGGREQPQGLYGSSLPADDEVSSSSYEPLAFSPLAARRGSRFSFERFDASQGDDDDDLTEATVEEREAELRQTLKDGATWLPVDVWLVDGELLVGRKMEDLESTRTFSSCSVEPLLRIFSTSNPPIGHAHHRRRSSIFSHIKPHSPLQLVLRLRTPASLTFPYVLDALQPLHDASLLTSYCPNAGTTTPAVITVVSSSAEGAEMVPAEDLEAVHGPRFVYRDAPTSSLDSTNPAALDPQLTPVAAGVLKESTGWDGQTPVTDEQRQRIVEQVESAHRRGIKVRYEGLPHFPVHVRENVRSTLVSLGVDYL